MRRIAQAVLVALSLPAVVFCCVSTIPIILFALPAVFFGNPLNLLYVLWWAMGVFGIYSGIHGVIAFGRSPYELSRCHQIGLLSAIIACTPLLGSLFDKREVAIDSISGLVLLGLLPAGFLFVRSIKGDKIEQGTAPNP